MRRVFTKNLLALSLGNIRYGLDIFHGLSDGHALRKIGAAHHTIDAHDVDQHPRKFWIVHGQVIVKAAKIIAGARQLQILVGIGASTR